MKLKLALIIAGGILLIVGIWVVVKLVSYLNRHDDNRPENRLDPWITNVVGDAEAEVPRGTLVHSSGPRGCLLTFSVVLSGGDIVLTNTFSVGRPFDFVLERSEDLRQWSPVSTNTGPVELTVEGNCGNQFYRATGLSVAPVP